MKKTAIAVLVLFLSACGAEEKGSPDHGSPDAETLAPAQSAPWYEAASLPPGQPDSALPTPETEPADRTLPDFSPPKSLVSLEDQNKLAALYRDVFGEEDETTKAETAVDRFMARLVRLLDGPVDPKELDRDLETLKALKKAVEEAWVRHPDKKLAAPRRAYRQKIDTVIEKLVVFHGVLARDERSDSEAWNRNLALLRKALEPWRPAIRPSGGVSAIQEQ